MIFLQAILSVIVISCVEGNSYCSKDNLEIKCVLCSDICDDKNETCHTPFRCPEQCSIQSMTTKCTTVCSARCIESKCRYTEFGHLQCSEGCVPGTTGIYCQELCPAECKECHQFNTTCISCMDDMKYCNEETNESISSSKETSEHECPLNCGTCRKADMLCLSCIEGYYGPACQLSGTKRAPEIGRLLLICFLVGVCFLVILCAVVILRQIRKHPCSVLRHGVANGNQETPSEASYHDYAYIDMNNIDSYYSRFGSHERVIAPQRQYSRLRQINPTSSQDATPNFADIASVFVDTHFSISPPGGHNHLTLSGSCSYVKHETYLNPVFPANRLRSSTF